MSKPTLYFAYGSNLNSAHFADWLAKKGLTGVGTKLEKVSNAYLSGYRLGFTRRATKWEAGVADVVKAKGERVWGNTRFGKIAVNSLRSCGNYTKSGLLPKLLDQLF